MAVQSMENSLKLNSHRITGLADATSDSDAVNYKQLKRSDKSQTT